MRRAVTLTTQSNEVGLGIVPLPATMREMVYLQVAATAALLTAPPITLQYLLDQFRAGCAIQA